MSKDDHDDDGDILIFMPGQEDIEDWKPTPIHSTKFDSDCPEEEGKMHLLVHLCTRRILRSSKRSSGNQMFAFVSVGHPNW
jgi:hypothetical protein